MNALQPTAFGSLSKTPLPELLTYCLSKSLSGTLVMEADDAPRTVLVLAGGAIVKVRVGVEGLRIGELLIEFADMRPEQLGLAIDAARAEGVPLGRYLTVERIASDEQVGEALREQIRRHIKWLAGLQTEVRYAFFETVDLLEGWGEPLDHADPLNHLWAAVQAVPDVSRMRQVVQRSLKGDVTLHPDSRVLRFGFSGPDRSMLEVLRVKRQTLAALADSGLLHEERLYRVLYTLVLSRHVKLGEEQTPLGVGIADSKVPVVRRTAPRFRARRQRTEPSAATDSLSPPSGKPVALRAEAMNLAERLDQLTYYEVLGIPEDADTTAVRRAFFSLARKWHPDKRPPGLQDVAPTLTRIFSKLTEAHQVLTNSSQRAEYDRMQKPGQLSEEQETVQRVLRAATNFRKAEVLAKKRDLAGAEKLAERATTDDPDQAEYLALYAWSAAHNRKAAGDGQMEDLLAQLEKALHMQPDNTKVQYYRAIVLKLAGKSKLARQALLQVVEKDPRNVDAARELRLSKMRGEDIPENSRSSGFLNRFFKKP